MGGSTGGYDEARQAIYTGLREQKKQQQRAEEPYQPFQPGGQYETEYSQMGQQDLDAYRQALAQGADPQDLYNRMIGGYRESPEYKAQLEAGQEAANRAAAASGMLGSGAEMQHAAERAQALRGQDVQNYLNRVLGLRQQYLQGQGGLGMGLTGRGFQGGLQGRLASARDIANQRMQLGEQMGQAYGGIGQSYIGEAQQPSWLEEALGIGGQIAGAALPFFLGPAGLAGTSMGAGAGAIGTSVPGYSGAGNLFSSQIGYGL
jgi:hypothetical protein